MDNSILRARLKEYCDSGVYPMHMPGHKRSLAPVPGLPYDWDLTEVEGSDDLHAAEGILRDAMERTARLWGSRRTWYLVNGSTCGLLASLYACASAGDEVIIARNCHKSVYHGIEVLNLKVYWLMPAYLPSWDIFGSVRPADVRRLLSEHPAVRTVVVTSPTYEGVISDIAAIAQICHEAGARLIVDEAHGAHLGLFGSHDISSCRRVDGGEFLSSDGVKTGQAAAGRRNDFPESALHLGADIVVQSAHKTLPSLTQTALLHLGIRDIALERNIEHALDIFETSSPSYPLMASIDGCTGLLADQGEEHFAEWRRQIQKTDETIAGLRHLKVLQHEMRREGNTFPDGSDTCLIEKISAGMTAGMTAEPGIFAYDDSRFLLRTPAASGITGKQLSSFLREECGIEPEMHCGRNVLLMSGCGDTPEGWERVRKALLQTDRFLSESMEEISDIKKPEDEKAACTAGGCNVQEMFPDLQGAYADIDGPEDQRMSAPEAAAAPAEAHRRILAGEYHGMLLSDAEGQISAEYVMAYPPGIPILTPGERITAQMIRRIRDLTASGSNMRYSLSCQPPGEESVVQVLLIYVV